MKRSRSLVREFWRALGRTGGAATVPDAWARKGVVFGALSILVAGSLAGAGADVEKECFNKVQDKVAWNYRGDKHWANENLSRLCRGTSVPEEPGLCFSRVMHSGVSHGESTQWEWENALSLCAGTNDAQRTVTCFQASLAHTHDWRASIGECQARPPIQLPGTEGTQVELPDAGTSQAVGTVFLPGSALPPVQLPVPEGLAVEGVTQVSSSCDSWKDWLCWGAIAANQTCYALCVAEPCAERCRECIENTPTLGIDCHNCVFGRVCGGGGGGAAAGVRGTKLCGECRPIDIHSGKGLRPCSFFKGDELISSGSEACKPFTQD